MKQPNILFILRGLPGSRRGLVARHLAMDIEDGEEVPGWPLFVADDFFINDEGVYEFDGTRLQEAHDVCQAHVENEMKLETAKIFVANTFSETWELRPYFTLARKYHYVYATLIVETRRVMESNPQRDKLLQRFQLSL